MKKIYVFDFDGTLTKRDTLVPLSIYFAKKGYIKSFLTFFFNYVLFKLKISANESLKRNFAKYFFRGKSIDEIKELLYDFFETQVKYKNKVYNDFINAVKNRNKVIIVSANFDFVVNTWLDFIDLKDVIVVATELEIDNKYFTGRINGDVCRGLTKAKRLKKAIDTNAYYIVSYADEVSDRDIMSLSNEQIWV